MINLLYFNISAKGLFQEKTCSWVLVSMMDFMPGKGEHETGILPLLREKRCEVVALRSYQRDVTHQYKQIQNGGTETM